LFCVAVTQKGVPLPPGGQSQTGAPGQKARLPGLLWNEPVGETKASMICVSPRRYLVMTGRLQAKQRRSPLSERPLFLRTVRGNLPINRPAWASALVA
jgi:hypothetical protein